jgi:hypothetical protein
MQIIFFVYNGVATSPTPRMGSQAKLVTLNFDKRFLTLTAKAV